MRSIRIAKSSRSFNKMLAEVTESHEPLFVHGDHANGVLLSEDDWRAIQETLYLLSIPGMRDSITEGLKTPLSMTSKKLNW